MAARAGGPDPVSNASLRLAIDKAKAQSVPKDKIERAVKRGSGLLEGDDYEEVLYEGYGPGGVAVMVDCLTDNRNRTVADVRHAFTKFGGNLGADGSVAYLFAKVGLISYPAGANEDTVMEAAIEAGAEDVVVNDDASIDVLADPADFEQVKQALDAGGSAAELAEVTMRASVSATLGEKEASSMIKLLEMLEDLDDVQEVYSNADIPDEILASM